MPTKLDEAHKKKRTEVLFFAERPRVLLRKRHRRLRTLLVLISAHKKKENRSSLFCGATESLASQAPQAITNSARSHLGA